MLLRPFSCALAPSRFVLLQSICVMLFLFGMSGTAQAQKKTVRSASSVANYKSRQMAAIGIHRLRKPYKSRYSRARYGMRHVRSSAVPSGARYEGVGYSSISANRAIRNSSFYGRRPIVAASVSRGRDGYFAAVYYK